MQLKEYVKNVDGQIKFEMFWRIGKEEIEKKFDDIVKAKKKSYSGFNHFKKS
jgi:hypothetical protein